MANIYFVTGTDTGVGKTVLTALLVRHLRAQGVRALAVKPLCSGGRADARILQRAQDWEVTLDEINPWHFSAPLAPVLAARRAGCRIRISEVIHYLRNCARQAEVLLVEGAGGLLSPLVEGFDSRDLIDRLSARVIVVAPNRLGAVNQVRLVFAALPVSKARTARVVLMEQTRPNQVTRTNLTLLAESLPAPALIRVPLLDWPRILRRRSTHPVLSQALNGCGLRTGS